MEMNPSLILFVFALAAYLVSKRLRTRLAVAKVRRLVDAGVAVTFVDVRTPAEFQERRIAGSVNVPVDQLQSTIGRLVPDKAAPLAVYCLSGSRAAQATGLLKRLGYTSPVNIGALSAWSGEFVSGKPQKKRPKTGA